MKASNLRQAVSNDVLKKFIRQTLKSNFFRFCLVISVVRDRAASFRVGGGGAKEECVKENFFVKLFFV